MKKYRIIGKQGEGTFSKVLKGKNIKTKQLVAIKCIKKKYSSIEQVNELSEIITLKSLSHHKCIISLIDILYNSSSGRLILVFNSMEKNLYELIRDSSECFSRKRVRHMMHQLLRAIRFTHANGIFHRDIKPENILVCNTSTRIRLQLADFGSSRKFSDIQPFTEYISTRWYRAPECLLTDGFYGSEMDIWSIGCVMYEIISFKPLFPGNNEANQMEKIIEMLGSPSRSLLQRFNSLAHEDRIDSNYTDKRGNGIPFAKSFSSRSMNLLYSLLKLDPSKRMKASAALRHPYFKPVKKELTKRNGSKMKLGNVTLRKKKKRIAQVKQVYMATQGLSRLPTLEAKACTMRVH